MTSPPAARVSRAKELLGNDADELQAWHLDDRIRRVPDRDGRGGLPLQPGEGGDRAALGRYLRGAVDGVGCTPAGGFYEFHGRHYDVPSIKMCPVPAKPVPILIGGRAEAALRRAARVGDGWMHAGSDDLGAMLKRLAELRREHGREREPFEVHVISLDAFTVDGVKQLEDLGVTDLIMGFRNPYVEPVGSQTLQQKLDLLSMYADNVIAKV
jgi:alkanesulfonate monooxygenase SsuD/methylene tetrahydromethanopterin reductase-like flavin-dependent oxidoreductase (luciferase family)